MDIIVYVSEIIYKYIFLANSNSIVSLSLLIIHLCYKSLKELNVRNEKKEEISGKILKIKNKN